MPSILIGVHVHAEPDRLKATLESLSTNTRHAFDLLLLPDGPDDETKVALSGLNNVAQSRTDTPKGAAACFNRLLHHSSADLYVLLESGAQVGPGWLDGLMVAVRRYPKSGLAGPSTNRAWNEQCVFPTAREGSDEIARIAAVAARRFGATCRTLEPLHSLADFCYLVRREVVEAIAEADEAYGLGPCWEMDYNIRAARAGFQALWACAAYVHRAPFTARRQREEAERFEASKHLYQDKFCGLRLLGLKNDYRPHCRGSACPNFAPAHLIQLRRPSPEPVPRPAQVLTEWPLVSCIMPSYNRRRYIPRSLRCFYSQDYPNLELVVVDDGTDSISDLVPSDPRIHYWRLTEKLSVGAKRNYANARARGKFIIHWDDDDWYCPSRVRCQITPLLENRAQVSGSSTLYYYNQEKDQAFRYEYRGTVCAWLGGLAYPKSVWEQHPFEPIQVAEDVKFLASIPPGSRFDLKDPTLCVAALHPANVSPKVTGGAFWSPEPAEKIRAILGPEAALPGPEAKSESQLPLVSCIMPTYNRRPFVSLSLSCFQRQTYPNKELLVVDDGSDAVGDLLQEYPRVRYIRANRRLTIGAKRNLACERAEGELIAHWDDDDWYSPERLAEQIKPLCAQTHDLTGLASTYVLQMPAGQFWSTTPELHRRMFVADIHGGTLLFRKSLWLEGIRYPEVNLAEDAGLLRRAMSTRKRILRLDNPGLFIYLRHGKNTWKFESGRFLDPSGWRSLPPPPGFSSEMLRSYRLACLGEVNSD